jgi:hypothetical protein
MIKESTLINGLREFGINPTGVRGNYVECGIRYNFNTCNIILTYFVVNSNIKEVYLSYPGDFNISFLKITYSPTYCGYLASSDKFSVKEIFIDEIFDYIFDFICRFDKDFRRNYRLIKLGI